MHIIHIAAELAPIAKVGGLADVVQGLSRELVMKGHDVEIILPKYDCMNINEIQDMTIICKNLMSWYEGEWHQNTVWAGWVNHTKVYFIEPHHHSHFFTRGCLYGCVDDLDRFLYFDRCCLDFLKDQKIEPDILHLHDWQSAGVALLYHDLFKKEGYNKPKIVTTIHNIAYQGHCAPHYLDKVGLKGGQYLRADSIQDTRYPEACNLLRGAILYSDFITTVSPTYAKEVLETENGMGLEDVLKKCEQKFKGILNGIDYTYWSPETDLHLPANFSSREVPSDQNDKKTIDNKSYIKKVLRERLNLEQTHKPIISCISRLVPQKGIELIQYTIKEAESKGAQFILLGASPIPEINAEFQELKRRYQENPNIHLTLHYHEELAHMIYAASDMMIIPSLFEPCGLTQMISLRYGTIPIVRNTGGLNDTIFDIDQSDRNFDERNGYTFEDPTTEAINEALDRALACWYNKPDLWRQIVLNGMKTDFSWNYPAKNYLDLYRQICV